LKILTKQQACELLQVPMSTLNYWVITNQIPYSRCGKRLVRFSEERLQEWMREREGLKQTKKEGIDNE